MKISSISNREVPCILEGKKILEDDSKKKISEVAKPAIIQHIGDYPCEISIPTTGYDL